MKTSVKYFQLVVGP